MRIKRLEIQGFKSFKDKTVVHFDHGITGIVGPNGCGKSNIVDAFFWVMGEQSYKHMRGSNSSDLIFNGSSKYSALGMAEATLIMEIDEVDTAHAPAGASATDEHALPVKKKKEVSVTRRLYRSGEGEYFMNGQPCRLKDIHELFMDTGVGSKGYSIIEQGQIDVVVKSKPEDRRLLIEDAAGIAKYKSRKKESIRKMEAAGANLGRLNDVLSEIERNLGSLERQAQKARRYKDLKTDLFDKEMTWGRRKAQILKEQIARNAIEKEELDSTLVGLRSELSTNETTLETIRVAQLTESKQVEALQLNVQNLSEDLAHEKSALNLSRQRQDDLSRQLTNLEHEKEELNETLSIENERLSSQLSTVSDLELELEASKERVDESNTLVQALRREVSSARAQHESLQRELMKNTTESTELRAKFASLRTRVESNNEQIERLTSSQEELAVREVTSREETNAANSKRDELKLKKEELRNLTAEKQGAAQELERLLKDLSRSREELMRDANRLRARLTSLEELAASHEGLGNGPKSFLDWAKASQKGSLFSVLADSISIKEGAESAIEGFLESRLESLMTNDFESALTGLHTLRDQKKGRAQVYLNSAVPSQKDSSEAFSKTLTTAGFSVLGKLSNQIQFTKSSTASSKETIQSLFQNVIWVESLSALAQNKNLELGAFTLVSNDGFVLESNGLLRGGSTTSDQSTSILGRKKAIEALSREVEIAEGNLKEKEIELENCKLSLESVTSDLKEAQAIRQTTEVEFAAIERDAHSLSRQLADLESQLSRIKNEKQELSIQTEKANSDQVDITERLSHIEVRQAEIESHLKSDDSSLNEKAENLSNQEQTLQTVRIQEASLKERTDSVRRELNSLKGYISSREKRRDEITQLLSRMEEEQKNHSGNESGSTEKLSDLNKRFSEKQELLNFAKENLENGQSQINKLLERLKALHKDGDEKTARFNLLAIEAERHSSELTHLMQNLEEKYGVGCLERSPHQTDFADPILTQEMTAEEEKELAIVVEELREKIRRLGEVNVMAIEEFDETKKRFDHLAKEKSDLEQSIQNLQEAIEHINQTSEERFKKAFDAIAERFERLFPIIFGGGSAKLSLVYPEGTEDILEAGVDILAQPPGKKVSNIGLLSGGEKALTAISLIFAIFMVKPSPFCLLDEVDAPLDDSNIGKFNALLREMGQRTQFIVITHNKKTMELNDTLYGVTMEEPGVSKIVSIELE